MSLYQDRFYNHFSKNLRQDHKQLIEDKNYLMRFNTVLPYSYSKKQNALSIVYSNTIKTMNLVTPKSSAKLQRNHFAILNPYTDWEFFCSNQERVDVMSFLLSADFMAKFSYYVYSSSESKLDQPFDKTDYDAFFIESIYKAEHNQSGQFLQGLFEKSNTDAFEFISPDDAVFEFLEILYKEHLYYNSRIKRIKGKKTSTKREVFKRIIKAHEYLNDSFEDHKITMEELALVCGLSEFHLYSAFKAVFQKTPHQYLNALRMQRAKAYLELGLLSISEISDKLLFPDVQTFSKLFKKTYGFAPSKLALIKKT